MQSLPPTAILPTPRGPSLCQTCLTTSCTSPATPAHFHCYLSTRTGDCRSAAGAIPQLASCCTPPAISAAAIATSVQALAVVNQIRELCPNSQSAAPPAAPALLRLCPCAGSGDCQSAAGAVPQPSDTVGSHHPFPTAGGGYAIGTGMGFARGKGVRMGGEEVGRRGRGREGGDGQWEVRCNPTTAYDRGFLQHDDNLAPLP